MPVVVPAAPNSSSALQTVPTQQVFDYLYDSQDKPLVGKQVNITLSTANATSITPQVALGSINVTVITDGNGFWSANLIPNANINPANTTYLVQPPGLDAYSISLPSSGGPFQSTSAAVLVNTPALLSPATTGITGSLTVAGNESVTGTLSVAGTTTLAGTTTGALTTGAASIGGDLTILSAFRLLLGAAISKIVPGATSLSLRNHADNADNLLVADVGDVTVRARLLLATAVAKIIPGATSISLRNNADNADNLLIADSGAVTLRGPITLFGISGHIGTTVPAATLGALQAGISTQSIVGTDSQGAVTVGTAGAGAPGAGAVIAVVNFGTTFANAPIVVLCPANNQQVTYSVAAVVGSFNIITNAALTISQSYKINYIVFGNPN